MNFDDSRVLDSICYDLVLGEYPRSLNRGLINQISNGNPPYTDTEVEENNITVNVNDLTHTRKMHDARTQFQNAFMKTGNHVTCRAQEGPVHERGQWSAVVTKEFNRPLKRSIRYFERQRAKFGTLVLHGISPGIWEDRDSWCAKPIGIEDVLIPSNTLLGFDNLPFFVLRRSFTAIELQRITNAAKRDPGWNMKMVREVLEWIDRQTSQLRSTNWAEIWAPEKTEERIKQDAGYYFGDQVPTIDCFDVYAYDDSQNQSGWIRRMILDAWSTPVLNGGAFSMSRSSKLGDLSNVRDFLFTSGKRKVADSWQNIIAFQFADLSPVFPARYHSVRSLGWLMYAPCHMGNRMRCKFYEAVLEALMQQFRIKSGDDAQKALKLDLVNRGFIDDTINPVPAAERWQVNDRLVSLGLGDNQQIIAENSTLFSQNQNYSQDRTEKTKFQVMAELNAVTSLVSAALAQAYQYEVFEDLEMFRRFCRPNSKCPDVRTFRANCFRQGVPEHMLVPEKWEIEHERVMGGGNKTMEMTIAQWMMEQRDKFDPEPQRLILRDAVLAITDDAGRAELLVPQTPVKVTDAVHDAQLAAGVLMQDLPVALKTGMNHIEYVETLLGTMTTKILPIEQAGGMTTPEILAGLKRMSAHIKEHIAVIAQDEMQIPRVKKYMADLTYIDNLLRGYEQRMIEAAQKAAQQGNGGEIAAETQAKIEAMKIQAQAKAENTRESHAQRTAQRQIQFEQKVQQQQQEHQIEMAKRAQELKADIAAKDLSTAAEIRRTGMEPPEQPETPTE